jgi:hypothetical protein
VLLPRSKQQRKSSSRGNKRSEECRNRAEALRKTGCGIVHNQHEAVLLQAKPRAASRTGANRGGGWSTTHTQRL